MNVLKMQKIRPLKLRMQIARIQSQKDIFSTSWFKLIAKTVIPGKADEPYYAIEALDYISVLAMTPDQKVILVKQYRPAVEAVVTELPSGHVEKNESPEESASRELLEETGYRASAMECLGSLWSDTGRMSNRIWYFFAPDVTWDGRTTPEEPAIEPVLMDLADFVEDIRSGRFEHSLNLSAVFLAFLKSKNFKEKLIAALEAK